jgi:nucleoside-diphosphate kinase
MSYNDCYNFTCAYHDAHAELTRKYQMMVFVRSSVNEIELTDLKTRKLFLRRTPFPSISSLSEFFIGAKIMVYSRQMEIVGFGDPHTERRFSTATSFACLVGSETTLSTAFMNALSGLSLKKVKLLTGTDREMASSRYFPSRVLSPSDRIVALEVSSRGDTGNVRVKLAESAARRWPDLYVPPDAAASEAGKDGCFGSGRGTQEYAFDTRPDSDATLMLVKPHAIREGHLGSVVKRCVEDGFNIEALESFELNKTQSAEFLEVYKGVSPVFIDAVNELCSGPCVAMALRRDGCGAVAAARALAGPHEYKYAAELRANTLRALFGRNDVENAVHTTDLAEDAGLELEYFFSILQQ